MYLADYRDAMFRQAFDLFVSGNLTAAQEGEMRGRYLSLDEISNLQWDDLLRFYNVTVEEKVVGD